MKRMALATLFVLTLISSGQNSERAERQIVLPNPKLLRCQSYDCAQLWQATAHGPTGIYPKQVVVDLFSNTPCPLGVMAHYDKSISLDELKSAIDARYGEWAFANNKTAAVKLWRVEPENFAIQLSETDKRIGANLKEEIGTKTVKIGRAHV